MRSLLSSSWWFRCWPLYPFWDRSYSPKIFWSFFPYCCSGRGLSTRWGYRTIAGLDELLVTGEIKHDECHICIFQVTGNQGAKSFLSCCIPQLQPKDIIAHMNILSHEVNTNCSLDNALCTPDPSSNLSWMYRVKMEVLPVDCSPRKTTLIFVFIWAKEDSDFFSCI